ncbi:MAG: molecular chaperone [Gammaproteobacteria bacterium]|nr:molecular chaperone [Gammaproteobacteria bacterium]
MENSIPVHQTVNRDSESALPVSDEGDRARADTYAILSSLLNQTPTQDLIDYLCHINIPDRTEEVGAVGQAWLQLKTASEAVNLSVLDDEFHDLFIGVGRGQVVPHGSWHLTGFLMDKPLSDLRTDLRLLGFVSDPQQKDPEDHISALFETMSILITSADIEGYQQRRFFIAHIHPWVGRFFDDLEHAPSADFYRKVSTLGKQFMVLESEYLNIQAH